jgi:hypothetical protein
LFLLGLALALLTAHGSFRINGFRAWDNATIIENMLIETDKVCARITLNSGPEILLAPATHARITRGTLTIESGSALIRHPGAFAVRAKTLTRDASGDLLAGPAAASIAQLDDTLIELKPLSQRP